jgi:succinoglycan biosynthesis transport protein ExoP
MGAAAALRLSSSSTTPCSSFNTTIATRVDGWTINGETSRSTFGAGAPHGRCGRMDQQKPQIDGRDKNSRTLIFERARVAVYKRMKAILVFPVALALCAATVALILPKRYDASVTIQIDPRQRSAASVAADSSKPKIEQPTIEAEIKTLQSEPIIRRAVEALHLESDPEFKSHWPAALLTRLFRGGTPQTDTEAAVYDRLSISRLRNTLLVNIRISSSDPVKSARVANAVADAYLKDQAEDNWSLQTATAMMGQEPGGGTASGNVVPTASERMFSSLLAQYGEALQVVGSSLVTKAEPPHTPAGPKPKRSITITFAVGLLSAIAIALLLEFRSFPGTRAKHVEAAFACPHMTSLPVISTHDAAHTPSRACRFILAEPSGGYAEAVRDTCKGLEQRRGDAASRVTLVVSALPGEGAEYLASNIAHQFALSGQSPLLVDADLRMKNLTRLLAGKSQSGLFDQIASRQPVETAILRDCVTGLHFLPASGPAPIPLSVPETLRSTAFVEAIAVLKQRFATIVLTAPPLLVVTDARILGDMADEIVFVTAWHKTPKRVAKKALTSLETNQRKVAGAVLTDISDDNEIAMMSFSDIFEEIRDAASLATFSERAA